MIGVTAKHRVLFLLHRVQVRHVLWCVSGLSLLGQGLWGGTLAPRRVEAKGGAVTGSGGCGGRRRDRLELFQSGPLPCGYRQSGFALSVVGNGRLFGSWRRWGGIGCLGSFCSGRSTECCGGNR
jgi:hypothetical protein